MAIDDIIYKKKYSTSSDGYYMENIKIRDKNINLGVDATYVIHLMHNGRLESIKKEFTNYRLKGHNYILFNQGYKSGKKGTHINGPALDLLDAFLYIFQHAIDNNYNNILILEDDFFFDKLILNTVHQSRIKKYVQKEKFDLYLLGCLPLISKEINDHTSRIFVSTGTHAVIYSRHFMELTVKTNENSKLVYTISDWDAYKCMFKNYMYSIPLCYQLFPATQNRSEWGKGLEANNFIGNIVKQFVKSQIDYINLLQLDKTHILGYPIYYKNSKLNYDYIEKMYNKHAFKRINVKFKNIKDRILYNKTYFQNLLII